MYCSEIIEAAKQAGFPECTAGMLKHAIAKGIVDTPTRRENGYFEYAPKHLGQLLVYLSQPRILGRPAKYQPPAEPQPVEAPA